MTINDIDPLADAPPSRYAFESDDEDEEDRFDFQHPSPAEMRRAKEQVTVTFSPDERPTTGLPMIFANGPAGAAWARGASLGEACGRIMANRRTVSVPLC